MLTVNHLNATSQVLSAVYLFNQATTKASRIEPRNIEETTCELTRRAKTCAPLGPNTLQIFNNAVVTSKFPAWRGQKASQLFGEFLLCSVACFQPISSLMHTMTSACVLNYAQNCLRQKFSIVHEYIQTVNVCVWCATMPECVLGSERVQPQPHGNQLISLLPFAACFPPLPRSSTERISWSTFVLARNELECIFQVLSNSLRSRNSPPNWNKNWIGVKRLEVHSVSNHNLANLFLCIAFLKCLKVEQEIESDRQCHITRETRVKELFLCLNACVRKMSGSVRNIHRQSYFSVQHPSRTIRSVCIYLW